MHKQDVIIVGGGIAGLQAAIQLGRSGHQITVIDAGGGRSSMCRQYNNVLGWPGGVSGDELRRLGRLHAEQYGVTFVRDRVVQAEKMNEGFRVTGESGDSYEGDFLLSATGVMDRIPSIDGLKPCMGLTVYVCPDCDRYEIRGKDTLVLGSGDTGAQMALMLVDTAKSLVYVNHEQKELSPEVLLKLQEVGIRMVKEPIKKALVMGEGQFQGVELANGDRIEAERAFIAFGGNEVRTDLLKQLGAERMESGHVLTDPRTKETTVAGVWAAGDIGVHAEQLTVAMGEGMLAAIWINKAVRKRKYNHQPVGAT